MSRSSTTAPRCTPRARLGAAADAFGFRDLGESEVAALARVFAAARPFPHVVLPDVVRLDPTLVVDAFPALDDEGWLAYQDTYQAEKRSFSDVERMPEPFAGMVRTLEAPWFLRFLERVTGVNGLFPDPYHVGAGLHASAAGGVMAPHTDSHVNLRLDAYKRVNVLIYLNPEWEEETGGCLELYDPESLERPRRVIVPRFGTCVIFRTDGRSVHGFTRPVAPGRIRRALALYYYTALDSETFDGATLTGWRRHAAFWEHAEGGAVARRLRMAAFRGLRFGSAVLAAAAHRVRPLQPRRT